MLLRKPPQQYVLTDTLRGHASIGAALGTPRFQIRPGHPDFLDLPWEQNIDDWDHPRLVNMPVGIHRHPVVFVEYGPDVYAIKELPRSFARNEFEVLRTMESRTHVTAEPAGVVDRIWLDRHSEQSGAVITKFVRHAFPYRNLVTGTGFGLRRRQMSDALASLLVELHLAGCFWGDCSLSNVLCRFDAGAVEAIMIDGETSVIRENLSDGQRQEDLEIMKENVAGAMFDLAAEAGDEVSEYELELGDFVEQSYHALWGELKGEFIIGRDEGYRVRQRIARLNDLGFAVGQLDLEPVEGGSKVSMRIEVGGRTFHMGRLRDLTGIEAAENQARLILNDLNTFVARRGEGSHTSRVASTMQWRLEVFEPAVTWIDENWPGSDPIQGFCDYLLFRRSLAASLQNDVPNETGLTAWEGSGFPGFPEEGE